MTKEPLVSVIIPNYNHQEYLKQRIDSILNQSFQDFEVILLDDKSTDNSLDILKSYAKHDKVSHLIINEKNSGSPFKQWFKGINLAKGKYIWIAESDDDSSHLFLSKIVKEFHKEFSPDIVFSGTQNINKVGINIKAKTRIQRKYDSLLSNDFDITGREFISLFLPDYCVIRNVSSTVFKKEIISPYSKKVINYKVIGDFYFWVNLCLENCSFSYVSDKLNFMRSHSNTVRKNQRLFVEKQKEYWRIHLSVLLRSRFNMKVISILSKFYIKKILSR